MLKRTTPKICMQEIARRLKIIRELAGKTENMAAEAIGVSRTSFLEIEKGLQPISFQNTKLLANFYGTDVNRVMSPKAVHTDLVFRFRKPRNSKKNHALEAVRILSNLLSAEIELENRLNIRHQRNYPKSRDIKNGNVKTLATQHANELRDFLKIGNGPISDIFSIIEEKLGIRLYQVPLSPQSQISGLYAYDDDIGACILLNAIHPRSRRVMSAAHELGHFLGTREHIEILGEEVKRKSKEERYAVRFSQEFLMPNESFTEYYKIINGDNDFPERLTVFKLANKFQVSIQACVLRLEELKLVDRGTWEWFEKMGAISPRNIRETLDKVGIKYCDLEKNSYHKIPERIRFMSHVSWNRELLSEGQLCHLLKLGRIEIRDILYEFDSGSIHIGDKPIDTKLS